ARPSCVCSFWALVFSSSVDFTFLTSLGSLPAWCGRQGYIVSLPTRRCSAVAATVDFSASRRMATICSSVNRLFLIGSSFAKKSHLSRIQWAEELGQVMRTGRALRVPRERTRGRGKSFVTPEILISERPPTVEGRAIPGHWEGDLILGLDSSAIGTLVERTTRFTMLLHLPPLPGHKHQSREK